MTRRAAPISLTAQEERILRERVRVAAREELAAERARIILLAAEGRSTEEIAAILRVRPARVSKWRVRFAQQRLSGLETAERSGKPRTYGNLVELQLLELLHQPPPEPHRAWTGALLAKAIGDVSVDHVWRVLRENGISLRGRGWTEIETSSPLIPRVLCLLGIYLGPGGGAFAVGSLDPDSYPPGLPVHAYLRLSAPEQLAALKRRYGPSRPSLVNTMLWAASGPPYRGVRTVDQFLADLVRHLHALRIHAFVLGDEARCAPAVDLHRISGYRQWKEELITWAAISMAGVGPEELLEAVDALLPDDAGPRGHFEWHLASQFPSGRARSAHPVR